MKKLREIQFLKANRYTNTIHLSTTELDDAILGKFYTEITFFNIDILKKEDYFNDFFKILDMHFIKYTKDNKPESLYIPSQAEIISLDDGFIDAYYDSEFANQKDEILHLTKGFDINKSIITYNVDYPNILELRFDSLFATNESCKNESIWDIHDSEVKKLFKESILNRLNKK